jgi:F-type H+-transporting ATPase subunit gamma
MPTVQNLKKKLQVIRSTRKLTRAMKTASTVKYSKISGLFSDFAKYEAQCALICSRYGKELRSAFSVKDSSAPPLYILLTSNKGMCGSFNTDLIAFFEKLLSEATQTPIVFCAGKKGIAAMESKSICCEKTYVFSDTTAYEDAAAMFCDIQALLDSGKISSVRIVYPKYQNMLQQTPIVEDLFDFRQEDEQENDALFVPDRRTFIQGAAQKLFISILYKKILETALGAQAATLMTMRAAYDSACEYESQLETQINRIRQTQVTADVIEVASDNSMKGEE